MRRAPLIAILLGFLLGAAILLATGQSPKDMSFALIQSVSGKNLETGAFNPRHIGEFLVQSMPIVLTGLSVGFAFRTGLFNIGAEGQLIMGGLAAAAVGLHLPGAGHGPQLVHLPLVLMAAGAAGALWGALPGLLKARFQVHEVVSTIMLNYVALHINNWAIVDLLGSLDRVKTAPLPQSALLKSAFLTELTHGSRLHWGFVPVLLCLLIYGFILNRTTLGFRLRAVGASLDGSRYAGISVGRSMVAAMAISGAFAGIAGAVITVGTFSFGRTLTAMEGYGFDGVSVALVGGNAPVGVLFSGLLFGMLKAAQPLMQSGGIPKEITGIIQAAILLLVAMKLIHHKDSKAPRLTKKRARQEESE